LRAGFAAGIGTSREQAGAAYYGVMEMGGNIYEQCLTIGHSNISSIFFDGTLGNGMLDAIGNADVNSWNPSSINLSIVRGGSFASTAAHVRTSDRTFYQNSHTDTFVAGRNKNKGGRGVRQF
jgi:formylglycine-generating enzyme required for sulfatase activity